MDARGIKQVVQRICKKPAYFNVMALLSFLHYRFPGGFVRDFYRPRRKKIKEAFVKMGTEVHAEFQKLKNCREKMIFTREAHRCIPHFAKILRKYRQIAGL